MISAKQRQRLCILFDKRLKELENFPNKISIWHGNEICTGITNYSEWSTSRLNNFYNDDEKLIMANFWFGDNYINEIFDVLNIQANKNKIVIGLRVPSYTRVPLHKDIIDDTSARYTLVIRGQKSQIWLGEANSKITLYGLCEFTMKPREVLHGALADKENLDLIQFSVEE